MVAHDRRSARTREYLRPVPVGWWLERRTWVRIMVRELTCVAVGAYAFFLLVMVARADQEQAFADLLAALRSPVSVVLHLVGLALVVFHAVTWLELMPKAVVLRRGEEKVPPGLIVGAGYLGWLVVSAAIAWIALG